MFCSNCGENIPDSSLKCPKCGHPTGIGGTIQQEFEGGAFKGFLILLLSFFTMPLKTLKLTGVQLREVGAKGALDVKHTTIPHLTWLAVASKMLASIAIVLAILWGLSKGVMSLGDMKYNAKDALLGLVMYPIGGILIAAALDWLIMIWFELLALMVNIANDIRRIADHSER